MDWREILKTAGEWARGLLFGTFIEKTTHVIRKEAFDQNDNLMFLLFGDYLGVPNPMSYYALELLPYMYEDLEPWMRRMQGRKSIMYEKAAQYDFD